MVLVCELWRSHPPTPRGGEAAAPEIDLTEDIDDGGDRPDESDTRASEQV